MKYKITIKSAPRYTNEDGKKRRKLSKMVLLATTYGMAAGTAGTRMNKTKEEAQEILDNFFIAFPKVKEAIETSKQNLRDVGWVEDWAGRRRHLESFSLPDYEARYKDEEKVKRMTFNPIPNCPHRKLADEALSAVVKLAEEARGNEMFNDIARDAIQGKYVKNAQDLWNLKKGKITKDKIKYNYCEPIILSANTGKKAKEERQCFNARIQGGAASLTKLAMINIANDEELKKCQAKLIITVHDEVLVECPTFYADKVEKRLPQIMIDTAKPYIITPMSCDPYNVDRWYADSAASEILHEYDVIVKGNPKKGIIGLSKDEAFTKLCDIHPELTPACIKHTLETGADLDFSL